MGVYLAGISLYAISIFHFYRFLATRDMFAFDLFRYNDSGYKALQGFLYFVMYIFKYILVFPFFAFFRLAALTAILAFLSKDRSLQEVLLVALAVISAIRVSAYYHEDLSRDLAKILPFAVLGIFIIDASFFTIEQSLAVIRDAGNNREIIFYCFIFLVALEFVLRSVMGYVMLIITGRRRLMACREKEGELEAEEVTEEAAEEKSGEQPARRHRRQRRQIRLPWPCHWGSAAHLDAEATRGPSGNGPDWRCGQRGCGRGSQSPCLWATFRTSQGISVNSLPAVAAWGPACPAASRQTDSGTSP